MSIPPSQQQIDQALEPHAHPVMIKTRLLALLDAVMKQSKLNPAFLPVIKNMAIKFIDDMDDYDLEKGINELREKYIPWLLGEASHENTPPK